MFTEEERQEILREREELAIENQRYYDEADEDGKALIRMIRSIEIPDILTMDDPHAYLEECRLANEEYLKNGGKVIGMYSADKMEEIKRAFPAEK